MPYSSVRDIELIDVGSMAKETISNDAFVNLERGISGTATIVLSNADYPLSATEGQAFVLILTGTVTDDLALIVPQESRVYVVDNRCTIVGTHSITMRPPVGGGVTVETGYQRALMYCDGSNVYPVASGTAAGGGSGAPTDASYLVGSAHALLTGERMVTDTSTITWDLGTAGQAKAIIPPDAISYTHLQNVSSSRILGRFTAGSGDVQEITPGAGLTLDAGTGVLSATAVGQPLDATLTALAGLATGANQLAYSTGPDAFAQTPLTPFARTLLDDADAATMRGTLSAQASDATLTALAGVTTGADTLSFFTGIDTASTTTLTAFMRGLLDDPDTGTARGTLGLGTLAQQDASAVAITGGQADGLSKVGTQVLSLPDAISPVPNYRQSVRWLHAAPGGIVFLVTDSDTGVWPAISFLALSGSQVGSISQTASATSYNTTSDVRLKECIETLVGALDVVRALRPVSFRWQADGSQGNGFLAHELMRQVPEAVTGEPDAINDDGTIRPQGVDHSKIVPHLTAALQELAAQVQTLTARIATLEAQPA